MKLPKQARAFVRNFNKTLYFLEDEGKGVRPQTAASLPVSIAAILAEEYAVGEIEGFVQCVETLAGILDNYESCLSNGRSNERGCANIAARHIKEIACKTYCT